MSPPVLLSTASSTSTSKGKGKTVDTDTFDPTVQTVVDAFKAAGITSLVGWPKSPVAHAHFAHDLAPGFPLKNAVHHVSGWDHFTFWPGLIADLLDLLILERLSPYLQIPQYMFKNGGEDKLIIG
ncbi:hypothetical protein JCM11641_000962 [Rhodosporidiobolus odoratus]